MSDVSRAPRPVEVALLASVFVVAACGLVYELAAGALASYVLGDSVLQFSTVIGTYLFAMGVGSYLSRFFERQLPAHFLRIELLVALVGGALPAVLFLANAYVPGAFRCCCTGWCCWWARWWGLEIPLVMRILRRNVALRDLVSQVLTFDYLGALAVSVAFPLLLVPQLGLIRTGLLFGLMNAGVALWALWLFRHELRRVRAHAVACVLVLGVLLGGFVGADQITTLAEDRFYQDRIVFSERSPWQRIVVTRSAGKAAADTACSSTATCSSPSATSTATTRPWCTRPWPRTVRRKKSRCWAAVTAWRCARCSSTRRSKASRWSSWTRP
jgi:spermidine synthase